MKETNCNAVNNQYYPYEQKLTECPNRLPCGICRLTDRQCPNHFASPEVTWDKFTCNITEATNLHTPSHK